MGLLPERDCGFWRRNLPPEDSTRPRKRECSHYDLIRYADLMVGGDPGELRRDFRCGIHEIKRGSKVEESTVETTCIEVRDALREALSYAEVPLTGGSVPLVIPMSVGGDLNGWTSDKLMEGIEHIVTRKRRETVLAGFRKAAFNLLGGEGPEEVGKYGGREAHVGARSEKEITDKMAINLARRTLTALEETATGRGPGFEGDELISLGSMSTRVPQKCLQRPR